VVMSVLTDSRQGQVFIKYQYPDAILNARKKCGKLGDADFLC